jgi:hypothetical protein
MRNRDWKSRPEVIKGMLGEEFVDPHIVAMGFIPYRAAIDGPHPFDRILAHRESKRLAIFDVKTKPRRNNYQDTGIDLRHYREYRSFSDKYDIPVFIAFADEVLAEIYGGWLHDLEKFFQGERFEYPAHHRGIIYFPLCHMRHIARLTGRQVAQLKALRRSGHDIPQGELQLKGHQPITPWDLIPPPVVP